MKDAPHLLRDPSFFGFVIFGLLLLLGSMVCHAQAQRTSDTVSATRQTAPSWVTEARGGLIPYGRPASGPVRIVRARS